LWICYLFTVQQQVWWGRDISLQPPQSS